MSERKVNQSSPRLMFDKIWDEHKVTPVSKDYDLLYIDRHIMHELGSDVAFAELEKKNATVRRPDLTFATQDHVVPTEGKLSGSSGLSNARYIKILRENAFKHKIRLFDLGQNKQGIVHVVTPEQAIALPGLTLVCGDSHTCTVGGLGALAWGIGTSEVTHVLATQTLLQRRPKVLRIRCTGALAKYVSAKDLILHIIGKEGASAGDRLAIEYCGNAVKTLGIEARLTLCNLSIEMGARMGMVAPDDTTFEYLANRSFAPKEKRWDAALNYWKNLVSDEGAEPAREIIIDASSVQPQITWGTSPEQVIDVSDRVPDPEQIHNPLKRASAAKAQEYMNLKPNQSMSALKVDTVFIGSCTNSRLTDLRAAATIVKDRQKSPRVRALVVPGSIQVKNAAEAEGLDKVFLRAGFEWRMPGCSMCVALNGDQLEPNQRCVSTSNRNFENRQGFSGRTHLASPETAAASAIMGRIADPRMLQR